MLVGAKELDLLALKYLYAGEILDFYKQFEKGKSENDEENMNFYRLMQEIAAPFHSKVFYMMSDIVEVKEMFRKAYLNEYEPFRIGLAMGKFHYESTFWLRLQRRLLEAKQHYYEKGNLPSFDTVFLMD